MKYIILIIFAFIISINVYPNEIEFYKGTYTEALNIAKSENKVLMIDFMTDWCKWCVELDKKVYTDMEVAAFANSNQINWKIDAEKGEGPELAKKFKITGYPTIVFVNGEGEEIDRIIGYLPAKDFLIAMKDFNNGRNTIGSLTLILKSDPENPEANFRMGKKQADYGNSKDAVTYFEKVLIYDPDNKSGFKDDAALYLAQLGGKTEDIEKFVKDYPQSDLLKQAYIFLAEVAYQNNNDYARAGEYYKLAFDKYGKTDDDITFSYGQYLITKMYSLSKKKDVSKSELKKGVEFGNECLNYVKGSVNEGSVYYYLSEFYFRLGDKKKANEFIDKAIGIQDKKSFREQKEKINK